MFTVLLRVQEFCLDLQTDNVDDSNHQLSECKVGLKYITMYGQLLCYISVR